jgi:hypothetical protein
MKRNTILLIVLAALIGIAMIAQQRKTKRLNTATASVKDRALLLPDLPVNDIKKIRIREGEKQVNLGVNEGKWTVAERSGYPASFDKISRTLINLRELKIAGGQPVSKESLGTMKLLGPDDGSAENTGLEVNLMNDKGESLSGFVAGKTVETTGGASSGSFNGPGDQRSVRVLKEDGVAWMVGDTFSDFTPNPADWLDKKFIDVRKLKSVQITAPNAADSWGAERMDENAEFTLMEPKNGDELDTAKAGGLASLLSNPSFTDVLPKDKATPDFMKGAITAKLDTFDGFHYNVKLLEKKEAGKESETKDYLTVNASADLPKERKPEKDEKEEDKKKKDEEFEKNKKELEDKLAAEKNSDGWVYEVSSYSVTALLKKRSEVLREKPKAPPTPEIKVPAPGAAAAAPSPAGGRKPISVTTPPVSIEDAKPAPAKPEEPKPEEPKPDAKPDSKPEKKKSEAKETGEKKAEETKPEEKKP